MRKSILACIGVFLSALMLFTMPANAEDTVASVGSDYVPISIDGSYDDWDDKPHTQLHYEWDTSNKFHYAALFRDEDYVYLHVDMSNVSYYTFNGYNYCFTVDGVDIYVLTITPDQSDPVVGNNELIVKSQNGWVTIDDAYGYVSRQEGRGDEWELRIPLSFFSKDPDTIKEITFHCTNLGPQYLVSTGTPTAPWIIAGTALLLAITGIVITKVKSGSKKSGTSEAR